MAFETRDGAGAASDAAQRANVEEETLWALRKPTTFWPKRARSPRF